jgi:hypothetical protein
MRLHTKAFSPSGHLPAGLLESGFPSVGSGLVSVGGSGFPSVGSGLVSVGGSGFSSVGSGFVSFGGSGLSSPKWKVTVS